MFQTEFCGSDYKFVISWDNVNDASHLCSADDSIDDDQSLFFKLNELYDNISKFTTEFVDCVKRVHNSPDDGQVHEINPNVSFKIENLKHAESYSDEVFLLRKEVEKLKNQKEQIEIDYKNCMLRHNEEVSKLHEDEEAKLRKLENKYKLEMSDLRIYFENSYTDYLKQLTELISSQYTRSKVSEVSSTSENETGEENYEITDIRCCDPEFDQHFTIRDHACKLEVSDESKIKIKENINKDLKNIIKTYNTEINKFKKDLETRKNEEVDELKRSMEVKYGSIIDTLQSEINQLLYDKALEDKVKELHTMLKKEGLTEIQNLQNDIDSVFLEKTKNEKDCLEQELKSRFQDQLIELSNEWRNKFEELLSDIIVDSAVKNVTYEINRNPSVQSPKKLDEVEQLKSKTIEKEYLDKLDQMRNEYEDRIQMMVSNFEENAEKLNSEKEFLSKETMELQKRNDHLQAEIEDLKATFVAELKTLQNSQDIDVEKMERELNNLRVIHEAEVSSLKEENAHLRKKINEILEQDFHDHETRSKIVSQMSQEIEDLISKEENGECITWPSDLANFELLFARKFCAEKPFTASLQDIKELQEQSTELLSENETNLEEILQERDALRKVNISLHGVVKVFTKYVTNCEEELNNTLINELVKGDRFKKNFSNSFEGDSLCNTSDLNLEGGVKKVHFAPDVSELLTSLRSDANHDLTNDRSVSVLESELNACLERLKNEAAAVLCLTAGKKLGAGEAKSTAAVQTDLNYEQFERNVEKIMSLEEGLTSAEMEIVNLTQEITRLTEKINSLESIEAYGEGAPLSIMRFQNNAESQDNSSILHYSDEFCPKCEKIIEEAKKEIEDRQAQVQAADNKLKSLNLFLERQTTERENERLDFDKKIEKLQEQLKEKERDFLLKHESEVTNLQQQNKRQALELEQYQNVRENLETKVKSYQTKIVKSKELADDLENKIAQKSELIRRLEVKLKEKEDELHQFQKEYQILFQQLECVPENNMKQLEELKEQHIITAAMIDQVKNEIYEVEKCVVSRTRELENIYLPVVSSSIISSPSEDVSVCDRIADHAKITSASDSDLSSPIHIPINQLSCLHDKLKRLFRAEEAALKKIQDQDMQLNKLNNSLAELELENQTLSESLSKASAKLSEAKTELNNWQHGHSSVQSEIQLELSRTIESLQNEIEYLKRCIDQKDENIRELTNGVKNSEKAREVDLLKAKLEELQSRCAKQADLLSETEKNDRVVNKRLATMLNERDTEIKRLHQKLSSLSSSAGYSRFNISEIGTPLKRTRVSFEDTSQSFDDSDVSRHAAIGEISALPHYLSIMSEVPTLKPDLNESLPTHSVRFNEKLEVEPITSIYQESDVASSKSDSKDCADQRDVSGSRIKTTKRKLTSIQEDDIDGKDCTIPLPEIPEVSTTVEDQEQSFREAEARYQKTVSDLQTKLSDLNQELDRCKEQCAQFESQISTLGDDVESKSQQIHKFGEKQRKLEAELQEKRCEVDRLRKRERKLESLSKEAGMERAEVQRKCEEYAQSLQQLEQRLTAEQNKSTGLNEALEKGKVEFGTLQQKIANLESELEISRRELQLAKEKVQSLMEISAKLEAAKYQELDSDKLPDSSVLEHKTSSLRNLTEKVQKEVERAEEMDKNILKSLESDSRGASFIDELLKISSSLSDHLKRTLFKMLQDGPEGLSTEEKNTLMQACGQNELNHIYQMRSRDEEKHLRLQLDIEQKNNKELVGDNRKISLELNRMELLLSYYDERMSFLVSKLDEYRNKAVKVEIELTSEKTSRKQLEISFDSYKKEICDRQIQYTKRLDESAESLNMALNENIKLKREIDSLKNELDALAAELNSVKIITQYHSDSESDLSRSLNPLKVKLNDVQEKYMKVRQELETKKDELRELRSSWNLDRANHEKLEHLYSVALDEKNDLQQKLVDMKIKFDDLLWQKQKVDEKLEGAELYEVKRRMARISKDDNLKKEQELMRTEQAKIERECKHLRENLLKINEEYKALSKDWKHVCEELKIVFFRMLRAEKNQRCLAFQKNYFIQVLRRCRLEFVTLTQSNLDGTRHTHDFVNLNITSSLLTPKQKFKSIVFGIIMIRRIQFLLKRRASSNHAKMVNYFLANLPDINIYPWCKTSPNNVNKKEAEKKTSKLTLKSNNFPLDRQCKPEMADPLRSLYQQFTDLQENFLSSGPSKLTNEKL